MELTEVVLCFECKWEGYLTQTKREEIGTGDIPMAVKAVYLCPECDLPLAKEFPSRGLVLFEENSVVVPHIHRFVKPRKR